MDAPIGIFDSGVGGLTVYRALHERLPAERFIYLGDTARVPYGTKSLATVERYGIENARFLEARGIKALVVACNTASALALPAINTAVSVPVIGVITPGAIAATAASRSGRIGVIATEATVLSKAYSRAIRALDPSSEVIEVACPLFVALAEEGWATSEVAIMVAREYLTELRGRVDTLVLGCTHYPILRDVIQGVVGPNVVMIDSGEATADSVESLLNSRLLTRERITNEVAEAQLSWPADYAGSRTLCDDLDHFYVTDAAERFARVAQEFLGSVPRKLEAVELGEYGELKIDHREAIAS